MVSIFCTKISEGNIMFFAAADSDSVQPPGDNISLCGSLGDRAFSKASLEGKPNKYLIRIVFCALSDTL